MKAENEEWFSEGLTLQEEDAQALADQLTRETGEAFVVVEHRFGEAVLELDSIPMADTDSGPSEEELQAMALACEIVLAVDSIHRTMTSSSPSDEEGWKTVTNSVYLLSTEYQMTLVEAELLFRVVGPSGIAGHILASGRPLPPKGWEDREACESYLEEIERWFEDRWLAGSVWRRGDREDDEQ